MDNGNNRIRLCGNPTERPRYSHSSRDEQYYTFPLAVERLSGAEDVINILISREKMLDLEIDGSCRLGITGEVRSFNNKSGVGPRLIITVFAKEIGFTCDDYENHVELVGTLCKPAIYRRTPMGREICDMMLAVNRNYGRSDYLPCIAWGALAKTAAGWDVGTEIELSGRLQSRKYIKNEDDIPVEKTAFEISAMTLRERTADNGGISD